MPIGGYPSQLIGNLVASPVDHYMKEKLRAKCYLRYCDDTVCLARSKAEAWRLANEYERQSAALGLVVKASAVVAPIPYNSHERRKGKKRRRQRGKRQGH